MKLKLDRKKFWQLYHKKFDAHGATTQATVDALNTTLDKFEQETRLKYISWFAFFLATVFHETGIGGNHFVPVKERRERAGSDGRANQDRYWLTGFYGRGLVQITWERMYLKVGQLLGVGDKFVKNPDLLLDVAYGYEAAIIGMVNGIFRSDKSGKKHTLARYLTANDASLQDYMNARQIINGDMKKSGLMIAHYANDFEEILNQSQLLLPVDNSPADQNVTDADLSDADASNKPDANADANANANININGDDAKIEAAQNSQPVEIPNPAPQNFWVKFTGIVTGIFTGTYVIPHFDLSDGQIELIKLILPYVVIGAMVALCWHYWVKKHTGFKLTELFANINSDPAKKDIKFVKLPQKPVLQTIKSFALSFVFAFVFLFLIKL